MSEISTVYLHLWTGDATRARELAGARYPAATIVELSHRELREGGWKGQLKAFRALQGQAIIFFFASFADSKQTELIQWSGLFHRCRETAMVDGAGNWRVYRRRDWFWILPKTAFSVLADLAVFVFWFLHLKLWTRRAQPVRAQMPRSPEVAYLFPYPLDAVVAGGAVSHIRGVLGGLSANGICCRIFSGTQLPVEVFSQQLIPRRRKFYVFWESVMLSYNFRFAREVQRLCQADRPTLLYQRHGRFSVAGAILARRLRVPLVLEYNGSEIWMADYWDPTRFRAWLRMCEDVMLKSASAIVVVSQPLKDELVQRGFAAERVLVNPNAVDPTYFRPDCGGGTLRKELGFGADDIVIEFVGTFSHWHGVEVLQQCVARLLDKDLSGRIRVLLVGQGPLHGEMREFLKGHEASRSVIFAGLVQHGKVREYLDAADILVSPHVPMPDGRPFFGSPTKLFEYMSMGKAIVASNLDQLAQVLTHNDTAILTQPGSVDEFEDAVRLLVGDERLRERLGRRAREVAIERHTWAKNAANVITFLSYNAKPKPAVPAEKKVQSSADMN